MRENSAALSPREGDGPRAVAWLALARTRASSAPDAQEALDETARAARLDARDRSLAFELMQGVLRRKSLLDAALGRLEGFKDARVAEPLRDVLRLGAYQHFFLDRVPPHALVHSTVEVARLRLGPRAAAFANAALQAMLREYPGRQGDLAKHAERLPAETRHSLPGWIVRLVRRTVGVENLEAALDALNRPLPLYARVSAGSRPAPGSPPALSAEETVAALTDAGIRATTRPDLAPLCVEIDAPAGAIVSTEIFQRGGLVLQDASAQLVAEFVGARPGMTAVDFCAAPGGKTAALAAAMEQNGVLIACDTSEARLARLRENLARLGLADFVRVRLLENAAGSADRENGCAGGARPAPPSSLAEGAADRVLVDAPCSGLGTLRRHPEIRWRLRHGDLERLAQLQSEILERAAKLVRPGGQVVYATCSFAAEENDRVIEAFLERRRGEFEALSDTSALPAWLSSRAGPGGWLRTLPHRDPCDSVCAVRLLRTDG